MPEILPQKESPSVGHELPHGQQARVSKGWHSPGPAAAGNVSLTHPGLPPACPGSSETWSDSWEGGN